MRVLATSPSRAFSSLSVRQWHGANWRATCERRTVIVASSAVVVVAHGCGWDAGGTRRNVGELDVLQFSAPGDAGGPSADERRAGRAVSRVDKRALQSCTSHDGIVARWANGCLRRFAWWDEGTGRARARCRGRKTVAGSEGANGPFFSPDGSWIGFWAGNTLKKVPAAGGAGPRRSPKHRVSPGALRGRKTEQLSLPRIPA